MSATVIERINKKLDGLDASSVRYQVLVALREFRAGWVDLGRLLTDIAYGGDYKEWGYDDFEVFCARELGLKKPTVKKLMVSFNYMKSYGADRLEEGQESACDAPEYETLALLKKVRDREDIAEEEKEELHRLAFDGVSDSGVLRKEINARLRDKGNPEQGHKQELNELRKHSRALDRRAKRSQVLPDNVIESIGEINAQIEALL